VVDDVGRRRSDAPPFGRAARIYNVIDSRQMYLQALLSQALRTLGHPTEAENSIHFSYEMVALSHATARELGYAIAPTARGEQTVSSRCRAGKGSASRSTICWICSRTRRRRKSRSAIPISAGRMPEVGAQIAVAAIRYFMLKFSRGKLIVFDIEEALSFEGETGPYLQYAVVAPNNIFNKLQEREGLSEADDAEALDGSASTSLDRRGDHTLWAVSSRRRGWTKWSSRSSVRSSSHAGEIRVRAGAAVQRVLSSLPDPQRGTGDRKRWRAAGRRLLSGRSSRARSI
jgi:hypothetical protein